MTCTIKRSLPAEMWSGNYSYLMFPMLPNDTLLALLMRANHNKGFRCRPKLNITLQKYLRRQLVEALIYLHQVDKIAHGNIKPDNTMITHDYRLVLIDFGHPEKVNQLIKHRIGTPAYRGPEVPGATCDESDYYAVERAKLYALGCTLFPIMFQNTPLKNAIARRVFN
jgi:serine/threonine protein kinase